MAAEMEDHSEDTNFVCAVCDADVDADMRWCPSCGRELQADVQDDDDGYVCAQCGSDVAADMGFCPSCGRELESGDEDTTEDTDDETYVCAVCGAPVDPNMAFCPSCGLELADDDGDFDDGGHRPVSSGRGGPSETNGKAIAALVIGILSLVTCGVGGIVALILAGSARKEIRDSDGEQGGEGLATAGLVLGAIALVIWGIFVLGIVAVTLFSKDAQTKFSSISAR